MVGSNEPEPVAQERLLAARGGVSLPAVLTGVVVSIGSFFLLSAVVGGILSISGIDAQDLDIETDAGIGAGIALIAAFFLSYLWGGYTAGRMSRGAGIVNGLLVPLVALLVGAIVGGIVWALGTTAQLNLPFATNRLPLEDANYVVDWTLGLGAAALIAMVLGGITGGMLGSRWHTKLERRVATAYQERETERWEEGSTGEVAYGEDHDLPSNDEATSEVQIHRHPSMGGSPLPPPPSAPPPDHAPTREFPPRS
jgi:hypothetical protein